MWNLRRGGRGVLAANAPRLPEPSDPHLGRSCPGISNGCNSRNRRSSLIPFDPATLKTEADSRVTRPMPGGAQRRAIASCCVGSA